MASVRSASMASPLASHCNRLPGIVAASPAGGIGFTPMLLSRPEATARDMVDDPAIGDGGVAADERMSKWRVALPFRERLYAAVAAFDKTDEAAALTGERRRLLDFSLRDFRRAGQALDADARGELERLRARLVELE